MAFMPYNLNKCINYRTNKHLKVTSLRNINQDYLFHAMFYKRDLKKPTTDCYRNQYKSHTIVFILNPTSDPIKEYSILVVTRYLIG